MCVILFDVRVMILKISVTACLQCVDFDFVSLFAWEKKKSYQKRSWV